MRPLLFWQAKILNRIYTTTIFSQIISESSTLQNLNYQPMFQLYRNLIRDKIQNHQSFELNVQNQESLQLPLQLSNVDSKDEKIIEKMHVICKSKDMTIMRENILQIQTFFRENQCDEDKQLEQQKTIENQLQNDQAQYNIYHVAIFSSLSKCTIWPNMLKCSHKLVPNLINFYNTFNKDFNSYLEYKFDPLILSSKFTKTVNFIKDKKSSNIELFKAIENNEIEKINELYFKNEENKSMLNQWRKDGLSVTHVASSVSNLQTMITLHKMGANFQILDKQNQTALFYAVKRSDLEIVRFLVEEVKVQINHKQYQDRTPIYLAAFEGDIKIVQYLHSKGGNPQISSKLQRTPLSKACYLGNVKVVEFLIKLGVELQTIDSKGRTALHNAAWGIQGGREGKRRGHVKLEDSPECVQLLIKAGHHIDFQDYDKFTPLFSAISSHAERSLRILVQNGANLAHKTNKNQSSVFIAAKYGHLLMLEILIFQYHCQYMEQSNQGYSPLAATLTLDTCECSHFLLDLYYKNNNKMQVGKIINCLIYFHKQTHLKYLVEWMSKQEDSKTCTNKIMFLTKNLLTQFEEVISLVFTVPYNNTLIGEFFHLILKIQPYFQQEKLFIKCLNTKIQEYFHIKNQHYTYLPNIIQYLLTNAENNSEMPEIEFRQELNQDDLIKLLQFDSCKWVQNVQKLSAFILKIIQFAIIDVSTNKILIFILRCMNEERHSKTGIYRFNQKQIYNIFIKKINANKQVTLGEFCLVHGVYDAHKLISSALENYQNKYIKQQGYNQKYAQKENKNFIIPKYLYSFEEKLPEKQSQQHFLIINPIENVTNIFKKLSFIKMLKPQEIQLFVSINKLTNQEQFNVISDISFQTILVENEITFEMMIKYLQKVTILGVDVEHYHKVSNNVSQEFVCLVQISGLNTTFLIDPLTICSNKTLQLELQNYLKAIFENKGIIKLFHSYDNDIRWLNQDFGVSVFNQILDTNKMYSVASKYHSPSLKSLAESLLGIKMSKDYQRADWRIRPLFQEMIDYAAYDAKVLPFLLFQLIHIVSDKQNEDKMKQLYDSVLNKRSVKLKGRRNNLSMSET